MVLTGAGGVGKTRLASEVALAVADEFPDGVWIVELGVIGEGAVGQVIADAVTTTLGIAPQEGPTIGEGLADGLAGRRLLLVLDNCEHVLDAAASVVTTLLAPPGELKILVTSRVSMQLAHVQEIEVPPLPLTGGASSPAVALFAARARGVRPNFALEDGRDTEQAVVEICGVLDGLPLAIELAAARMAGMGAIDVRDRLGDRFRLLEGPPAAPRRHRSLPDLVGWSVELLGSADREVLARTSVFAGGFDAGSYAGTFGVVDDVELLRSLDRLVRSSLVVGDHGEGRVRYRLLETIRQHGLDTLENASLLDAARDAHARYFAAQAADHWARWNGPGWRSSVDWLTTELANLRAAFQWSCERDMNTAVDVAAHAALIGTSASQFEPIGWAERLLEPATTTSVARLPRLYAAAGYACFVGRAVAAAAHAERAVALEAEPGFDPCEPGLAAFIAALANVYAGNLDRYVELATAAARLPGSARAFALPALVDGLQVSGRVDEAQDRLEAAVAAARDVGSPFWLAYALWTAGLTLSKSDPSRALSTWDQAIEVVDQHGVDFFRGFIARDAARLHATEGDVDASFELYARAIDMFHAAGNVAQLIITLA
ncbi:MAG TPA: NB-ARC domain-containing protein, partial [Acidimicrobiia bacterium]|nr:NB-ARC domain-containing protein [Acidimicrobiia bacterium]